MRPLNQSNEQYQTQVEYHSQPSTERPADGLFYEVQLRDELYASVTPSPSYIQSLVKPLAQALLAGFFILLGVSIAVLSWLIRTQITRPISRLADELSQLEDKQIETLTNQNRTDEVGRLAARFQQMYQQLSNSYEYTRQLADYDALTELPNRRRFLRIAEQALKGLKPATDNQLFLYIDLDNFKHVNDKYGHDLGDALLTSFATSLSQVFNGHRTGDQQALVARLAGDEFAVMMPPNTPQEIVHDEANQLLNLFAHGYQFEQGTFPVTVSIGIAAYPQDGETIDQLISSADMAMYHGKEAGKNQISLYSSELALKMRQRNEIENELRNADFDAEFTLLYMPICNEKHEIVGAEALLRWHSPTLGQISPVDFIPVAESTGHFKGIDEWVIQRSMRDYPELRDLFGQGFVLSINLSSAEIGSNHIPQLP